MKILAIETSCDETAASIVEDGVNEIATVLATSRELHEQTGGVVPEVAARKQVEFILPVIEGVMKKAGQNLGYYEKGKEFTKDDIDAIAVTVGPGLIGSLLVGVEAARALALAWDKPLIPVNHLVGHIYSNWVKLYGDNNTSNTSDETSLPKFPALVLIVSGGHTDLVLMKDHGNLEYLGGTLDDAAGEAFDKTARLLGISQYLGGAKLSKVAAECKTTGMIGKLPRPKINDDDYEFSFSGLKSAVKRIAELNEYPVDEIASEFENAVVDVLVKKTIKAATDHKIENILLGGGVSANKQLRTRLKNKADTLGIPLFVPPIELCGDTSAYIASAAYFNNTPKSIEEVNANPSLQIDSIV